MQAPVPNNSEPLTWKNIKIKKIEKIIRDKTERIEVDKDDKGCDRKTDPPN